MWVAKRILELLASSMLTMLGSEYPETKMIQTIFDVKYAHENMTLRVGLKYQQSIGAHDVEYLLNESAVAQNICYPCESAVS